MSKYSGETGKANRIDARRKAKAETLRRREIRQAKYATIETAEVA